MMKIVFKILSSIVIVLAVFADAAPAQDRAA